MKHVPPHPPGSTLALDLIGVNDPGLSASGQVVLRLLDSQGKEVLRQTKPIQILLMDRRRCRFRFSCPARPTVTC